VKVKVRLFASFREAAGRSEMELELKDNSTLRDLIAVLDEIIPGLAERFERGGALAAVNGAFAKPDRVLSEGDVVAVFPPVSGGGVKVALFYELPSLAELIEAVSPPRGEAGAIAIFLGVVRSNSELGRVLRLEYEAYQEMALAEMEKIRQEALSTPGVKEVVIYHALGARKPGDTVMMVAVASEHRAEAFETLAQVVNGVKNRVPIWKKEITEGGDRWIEEGRPEV